MEYKIAILGNKDTIAGFRALGVETIEATAPEDAREKLVALYKEERHAVVFITEEWADILQEHISELAPKALPAIVAIPSQKGSTGAGLRNLGKIVEQAVGSDIFKN